jgi:hypothetical protein
VLAKELRDLEQHQLLVRVIHEDYPISIEYVATVYAFAEKRDEGASGLELTHRKQMLEQ